MDSMVNRYTADRRVRSDDAYTPGGAGGKRPDRSVIVYAQRAREAFRDVPIVIGGIEASLRRIAHFDYWSEKVRRSVLLDAKADLLVYGNGERQICEIAHRLAAGEAIGDITDMRGTAFARGAAAGGLDRDRLDASRCAGAAQPAASIRTRWTRTTRRRGRASRQPRHAPPRGGSRRARWCASCGACKNADRERSVIRMPSLRAGGRRSGAVRARLAHPAPGVQPRQCARAGAAPRRHDVWLNPPPIPLTTAEMDWVYERAYQPPRRIRATARPASPPTR